jgi:hypothetical protein
MQAVQRDSIDLITRQNQRLRAQLNRGCQALDFYAGFYMKGNKDGRLCEDRDEIMLAVARGAKSTNFACWWQCLGATTEAVIQRLP